MGRKGMSAEEKRVKLLDMFHSSEKGVFTMVEVEKEGPKTGVVRSAVLDVTQLLIDDGQIEQEKIGSTNYCWSFPAKQAQLLATQTSQLAEHITAEKRSLGETQFKLREARDTRVECEERSKRLKRMYDLKLEINTLEEQLEVLKENDPVEIAKQQASTEMCLQAANRWLAFISEMQSDGATFFCFITLTSSFDHKSQDRQHISGAVLVGKETRNELKGGNAISQATRRGC